MVRRTEVEKLLNLTTGILIRLCRDLNIKEYKHDLYVYLQEGDVQRIKEHIEKYEPYLLKKKKSNAVDVKALQSELKELESQQLNGDVSIDSIRKVHEIRLKLKQHTGSSNIMCVSVNDTNAMR